MYYALRMPKSCQQTLYFKLTIASSPCTQPLFEKDEALTESRL